MRIIKLFPIRLKVAYKNLFFTGISVLVTGCGVYAGWYDEGIILPKTETSEICRAYIKYALNPAASADGQVYQDARAEALKRRGENCDRYKDWALQQIAIEEQRSAELNARSEKDFNNLMRALAVIGSAQSSRELQRHKGSAFLKNEYIQGFNKVCVYDRLGSVYAITIEATQLCPLSQ
jgi:hypothetical protein